MIISKLQGGLGNQLFQWAIGKNLSVKYNCELYLDTRIYNSVHSHITNRKFTLSQFPFLQDQILNPSNQLNWVTIHDNFTYREIPIDISQNYYLDGYFQSEKYFEPISSTIKNDLRMTEETKTKLNKELYPSVENSISIHVRRGDYVNQQHNHPVMSLDYYNNGIEKIGKDYNLIIFSDDIEWCKQKFTHEKITFVENLNDVESLWLMSLCTHNIIANSTFSWWGAWLNENPNKIVIAPNLWFGSGLNLNTSDIIPTNWIKI